jgi:environmental stress-induced protein Ves
MSLEIAGRGSVPLDTSSQPFAFPGDVDLRASLRGGPVDDLNVMTRRGRFRALVTRVRVVATHEHSVLGDEAFLLVSRGSANAVAEGRALHLTERDALRMQPAAQAQITPRGELEIVTIDLWRCA